MKIIIGADIAPVKSNELLFEQSDIKKLVGEDLLKILNNVDYRIFNLEVPLTDKSSPIIKQGSCMKASQKTIEGMKALNIDLFTLANNHIMDQGVQGLTSTINELSRTEISYVGVGSNLSKASKPFYFNINNIKFGVYACAEHEFSIAGIEYPGANPFDPFESLNHIFSMKEQCDYIIVLYHGGKEHYRYPSPYLQKVCRKLIDNGANLVICQHSHCIGCKEDYKDGTIVYGQGNFLFNEENNEFWNTSLLVEINELLQISYIPIKKVDSGVRLAVNAERDSILNDFYKRSDEIKKQGFVELKYKDFAKEQLLQYILFFSGIRTNPLMRIINKLSRNRLSPFLASRYMNKVKTGMRNYIECEAHRELLLRGLCDDN